MLFGVRAGSSTLYLVPEHRRYYWIHAGGRILPRASTSEFGVYKSPKLFTDCAAISDRSEQKQIDQDGDGVKFSEDSDWYHEEWPVDKDGGVAMPKKSKVKPKKLPAYK